MITLGLDTAVWFLEQQRYLHLSELVALSHPALHSEFFGDADPPTALVLVSRNRYPHLYCCGYDEGLWADTVELLATLPEPTAFTVSDPRAMARLDELGRRFRLNYPVDRGPGERSRSYVCTSPARVPPPGTAVSRLTPADERLVSLYPEESRQHGWHLPTIFRHAVLEGGGVVYVVRDGPEIAGFLWTEPAYREIWDVEGIHVRSELRGQGLGRALVAAYAQDRLAEGFISYYSAARNEASERTATGAGFTCCREDVGVLVYHNK